MSDNRSPEVDAWFEGYANPQKALVEAVRRTSLDADERVTETIKWQAPTFMYRGNIASFYPKSKEHVSLMFHTGASLPRPDREPGGEGQNNPVAPVPRRGRPFGQDGRPPRAGRRLDRGQGRPLTAVRRGGTGPRRVIP